MRFMMLYFKKYHKTGILFGKKIFKYFIELPFSYKKSSDTEEMPGVGTKRK